MRYRAPQLMRRGARPCGDGSPGPSRDRSGCLPSDYKSQKPAAFPLRLLAPSPGRRAGERSGGGDAPVSGRQRGRTRCPRRGRSLPWGRRVEERRKAAQKERLECPLRVDTARNHPGFPPPLLGLVKGTRALKSAAQKVRVPPQSTAAGTRAG